MLHTGPPPPPPLPAPASCARARLALRAVAFCAAAPRACAVRRSALRAPPAELARRDGRSVPQARAHARSQWQLRAPLDSQAVTWRPAGRPAAGTRCCVPVRSRCRCRRRCPRPRPAPARSSLCERLPSARPLRSRCDGRRARAVHRSALRAPCRRLALTHASNGTPARPTHLSIRSLAGGDMAAGRPARGGDSGSAVGAGVGGRGVG
jgi:hypothetical protein